MFLFFQEEDGIRDLVRSRGLGDVYKRQAGAFIQNCNLDTAIGPRIKFKMYLPILRAELKSVIQQMHDRMGKLLSLIHI